MTNPILVLMAGGYGERFWPRSRRSFPKQLLSFDGEKTLLEESVARVQELTETDRIYVVTNCEQATAVQKQLPFLPSRNIIVEPQSKNTAPCIGLATVYLQKYYPEEDPVIAFLPSDCRVGHEEKMRNTLRAGFRVCMEKKSGIIFGMEPTRPETGYGYIELGQIIGECTLEGQKKPYYRVKGFREKPYPEDAETLVAAGNCLWNGGIFIWQLKNLTLEMENFLPELYKGLQYFSPFIGASDEMNQLTEIYATLPPISFDYGILEKTSNLMVIPSEYGWDDLGCWTTLERILPPDESGNVSQGEFWGVDTHNCIIHSLYKPVTMIGVSDLIIVETEDVLLVCAKNQAQNVKKLLQELRERGRVDLL